MREMCDRGRLRIALVAPFGLRARGTTRARILPLARELARRGHATTLLIPPYDSPEDAGRRWTEGGVDVINLPLPSGRGFGSAWHLWLAWRLWRATVALAPDVAHIFKPKGPSGLVGAALWAGRRSPLIVLDSDDWEGPGGWNDDPRAGYSPLQRRFFAWQERFGLSHAHAWTVASETLRDRAIACGATAGRVFVLPNGAPAEADFPVSRSPSSGRSSPMVILYTRFAGVRPVDVAGIWRRVAAWMPALRLTVVGRGLAGEERELGRLLPEAELLGWVEPREAAALFARSSLAMIPWADTPANRGRSSVKVRELMAAGLPLVAYAVGELPATLGDAALLAPAGDADAFAAAIVTLLTDPERAQRLGRAAQQRARERFAWNNLATVAREAYAVERQTSGVRHQASGVKRETSSVKRRT